MTMITDQPITPPVAERASLAALYKQVRNLSDKGTVHSYIPTYAKLLEPYRDWPGAVVEIGVDRGGSLLMWRAYFSLAEIHGIEILAPIVGTYGKYQCAAHGVEGDIYVHYGADAANSLSHIQPDFVNVVIDDGDHDVAKQIEIFQKLYPTIKNGGIYIIEDVHGDEEMEALLRVHDFEIIDLRAERPGQWNNRLAVARK